MIDAYQIDDQARPDLHLSGLDLDVELAAPGRSPYTISVAPDTRAGATSAPPGSSSVVVETRPPTIKGGTSRLAGTVSGPEGPVAGATVRLERHTSGGVAVLDVVTDEVGHWGVSSILGGRYRIRAWLTGELTMDGSRVTFLAQGSSATADLAIARVDPGPHLSFTYRGDLYLGSTGLVAASVTTSTVDDDGVVNISGISGAMVALAPTPGLVALPGQVSAGDDGTARFVLRCDQVGAATGVVQYQNRRATFVLPACVNPPPPPELAFDGSAEGGAEGVGDESYDPPAPPAPTHQVGLVEVIDG
ncbi:MAG: carboxypeptidase regulatory-like domain-containing protein [Actinomycetia bacterium]|nr:carboxypeptidase regulatory-like domain-containing protein [Actinomycetes bacterium]